MNTLLQLFVLLHTFPTTFDWTFADSPQDAAIYNNLMDGLVELDARGAVHLRVAESIKTNRDSSEYRFTLRKDARWSDGQGVEAQHFIDAWIRLLGPQSASPYLSHAFEIQGAKEFHQSRAEAAMTLGLEAKGQHQLVVKLARGVPHWEKNLALFAFFPIRKDLMTRHGADWNRPGVLVTNGPFVLKSIQPGKEIVFSRNPHALKSSGNVAQVVWRGEKPLDIVWKIGRGTNPYRIGMSTNKFPLNNPDFREALTHALEGGAPQVSAASVASAKKALNKSGVAITPQFQLDLSVQAVEPDFGLATRVAQNIKTVMGAHVRVRTDPAEADLYFDPKNTEGSDLKMVTLTRIKQDPQTQISARTLGYRKDQNGIPILRDVRLGRGRSL